MKKWFILALVFITFFVACGNTNNNSGSLNQMSIIPDMDVRATDILWITMPGLDMSSYVFRSKDEVIDLENKISEWAIPFIKPHFEIYDDAFFVNNVLVMVDLTVTSGSIIQVIDRISVKGNELNVKITRFIPGLIATDDMVFVHAFIPIERYHFDGEIVNIDVTWL